MYTACYLSSNQLYSFLYPYTNTVQNALKNFFSDKKFNWNDILSSKKINFNYPQNDFFKVLKSLNAKDLNKLNDIISIVENIPEENILDLFKRLDAKNLYQYPSNSINYAYNKAKLSSHAWQQYRTFKTLRNSDNRDGYVVDHLGGGNRNVSGSWLENIFGFSPKPYNRRARKGGIFSKKRDLSLEAKLKDLIVNKNILPEERDKLKISFAEGYMAGQNKKSDSEKKLNILTGIREVVIFIIIIGMLVTIVGGPIKQWITGGINGSEVQPESINVTFADVKGIPEAHEELGEIVDYLKNPDKYLRLGGKLPKGVLLVGPPGTGKTLLARAVAGEAKVPFFHAVGSEFDEVLVGQGARRVRNLFAVAKEKAPCVVFIDEIDSVGAKRSKSEWHPYANQTVNQLLAEMDGFHKNEGIIVLGATNRKEDLDKALIRPGRFDSEIFISQPDLKGRTEIFDYYLGKVKYDHRQVSALQLAKGTTGFTGADIENLVNQAALRAAKDGQPAVTMKYLESARDKIIMGPEKKNKIPDVESNRITAYHEAGHTLVSFLTPESMPLHKVTIIPRGPSLGHTASMPDKEMYYQTKVQLLAHLDTLMGGRAAEEIIFGSDKITSGASDDLKKATSLATALVKLYGMSDKVGLRVFDDNNPNALVTVNGVGDSLTETIDTEINKILEDSYTRAKSLLKSHSKEHHSLANALLKFETLNIDDIRSIMEGKPLLKRS